MILKIKFYIFSDWAWFIMNEVIQTRLLRIEVSEDYINESMKSNEIIQNNGYPLQKRQFYW